MLKYSINTNNSKARKGRAHFVLKKAPNQGKVRLNLFDIDRKRKRRQGIFNI